LFLLGSLSLAKKSDFIDLLQMRFEYMDHFDPEEKASKKHTPSSEASELPSSGFSFAWLLPQR